MSTTLEQSPTLQAVDGRAEIDRYIRSLDYDPRVLLSVQTDGSTESQPDRSREARGNAVILTTRTQHSLRKNLSEVAILRPTAGVVYPGALVLADQNLMEGRPSPIGLPRGPITLSVDLPGLANARRTVAVPSNSAVQDAVTALLEEWNQVPASQGYVNAARSFLELQVAFSSQQIALDLGFSAKWTAGSASSQLSVSNHSESSSVLAYFKQVFYTVAVDTPARPSDVFGAEVTVDDLRQVMSAQHPPAYVRSVDYGRVLMIRMQTSSRETKAALQAAFKQVVKGVEVGGSTDNRVTDIVKNSTFTVVAIGGGAETAAQFSGSEEDLKRLREYIQKDATYRRDNPGAPIAYNVAFLKDHQLATMGFSTDYTEIESVRHPNGFVRLRHDGWYVGKFEVTWEEPDAQVVYHPRRWESGNKTAGYTEQIDLPGDARNVRIRGWAATGLAWDPWGEAINVTETGPTNKCYRIAGTTLNRHWDHNC